jgi:Right handed beta helix region
VSGPPDTVGMRTHRHPPPHSTRTARRLGVAGLVAFGTVAAAPAMAAAEASLTCGAVVTTDVRLDADLVDCAGSGLVVGASEITIDLAGHVVDGTGSGAGIDVSAGHDDLRITGGTVRDFQFGIHFFETSGARVDRVTTESNTIGVIVERSDAAELDRVSTTDNASNGIEVTFSDLIAVRRSTIADNGHGGIFDVASVAARYERNTVVDNVASGLALWQSSGAVVHRNQLGANGTDGIELAGVDDAAIVGNEAFANDQHGISIDEPGNSVARNRAFSNQGAGITAPEGTVDGGRNRAFENLGGDCTGVVCR